MKCTVKYLSGRFGSPELVRISHPNAEYFGQDKRNAAHALMNQQSQSVRSLHRTQLSAQSNRSRRRPTPSAEKKNSNLINMSNYLKNQMQGVKNRGKGGRQRLVALDRRQQYRLEPNFPDGTNCKRPELTAKDKVQFIRNKLDKRAADSHNLEPYGRKRFVGQQLGKRKNIEDHQSSQSIRLSYRQQLQELNTKYEAAYQQTLTPKYDASNLKSSKSTQQPQQPLNQTNNHIHTIVQCSTEHYPSDKLQSRSSEWAGSINRKDNKKSAESLQLSNSPVQTQLEPQISNVEQYPSIQVRVPNFSKIQMTKRDSQIAREKYQQEQMAKQELARQKHNQITMPSSQLSRVVQEERPNLQIQDAKFLQIKLQDNPYAIRPNRLTSNSSTDSLKLQSNITSRIRGIGQHSSVNSKLTTMKINRSNKSCTEFEETLTKIEIHLEIVNRIGEYVENSEQLYEKKAWDKENFLIYKKYYLERLRVEECLHGGSFSRNCFTLSELEISREVLIKYINTEQVRTIYQQVKAENIGIKRCLEGMLARLNVTQGHEIFNMSIEKAYIGRLNSQIYGVFARQVKSLIRIRNSQTDDERLQATEERLLDIIQLTFLIQEFGDCFVKPFSECEQVQDFQLFFAENERYFWAVLKKYGRA